MPDYRLYLLDRHSGHIKGVEELCFADDVSAIHAVQQRQCNEPLELWRGTKKVVHLDALPEWAQLE